jgi:hypothetical protein
MYGARRFQDFVNPTRKFNSLFRRRNWFYAFLVMLSL